MTRKISPLRYPGGKATILPLMIKIIGQSGMQRYSYVEPYAGGAGLALGLLYGGHVKKIYINDLDPAIWSFWKAALDHTNELISCIKNARLTVDEWLFQRSIVESGFVDDPVSLGFAAFYMNRTCRSGIVRGAGVIGGLKQNGNYKMGCRFNKEDLISRIYRIEKYKSRINLTHMDAVDLIKNYNNFSEKTIFYIDPPYYEKGSSLYLNSYNPGDHLHVAETILNLPRPWAVTYDNVEAIRELYVGKQQLEFDIQYSVQVKRSGSEILIASDYLTLPE